MGALKDNFYMLCSNFCWSTHYVSVSKHVYSKQNMYITENQYNRFSRTILSQLIVYVFVVTSYFARMYKGQKEGKKTLK